MPLNKTFETVAQWEKRTGRKYLDTAPVYSLNPNYNLQLRCGWNLLKYNSAKAYGDRVMVVATEVGAPPDDWRPEC